MSQSIPLTTLNQQTTPGQGQMPQASAVTSTQQGIDVKLTININFHLDNSFEISNVDSRSDKMVILWAMVIQWAIWF